MTSTPGPRGGYRLARSPARITLLEVVEALEGADSAFRCTEIRRRGPASGGPDCYPVACGIARAMGAAEEAWRSVLRARTLADLQAGVLTDIDPGVAARSAAWMEEVVR